MTKISVCIIGAGVVGISTAFYIYETFGEENVDITMISEKFYNETTSYSSGGLWEPYQIAGTPEHIINNYGRIAFDHFLALYYSKEAEASGVKLMTAYNLLTAEQDATTPSWADITFSFTCLTRKDLNVMKVPEKYVAGFSFGTLVIDQKYYLRFMMERLKKRKITIIQCRINHISELYSGKYHIIVNCSGIGAREVVNDESLYPIRGQVLRVKAPWLQSIWFFGRSYIIPNIDTCVIGGTAQKGDWNTTVSNKDTEEILNAVSEIFPGVKEAPVEVIWAGLRPGRTPLRLDSEVIEVSNSDSKQVLVVHNYGHGGSGVTLAMGCAHDVVHNHIKPFLSKMTS